MKTPDSHSVIDLMPDVVQIWKDTSWRSRIARLTITPAVHERLQEFSDIVCQGAHPENLISLPFQVKLDQKEPIRYWDAAGDEIIPPEGK